MALEMAQTRVKFSLPYISTKDMMTLVAGRGGGDAECEAEKMA